MVTWGRALAALVVLATTLGAPGIASAATMGAYSTEVGPNVSTDSATREAVTALQDDWRAEVNAAGGIIEDPVRFLSTQYTEGQTLSGIMHSASDSTTLAIHRTRYTSAASPVYAGNSTSLGTLLCAGGTADAGQIMQGAAPRPDVFVDDASCSGTGGFYYNAVGGAGEGFTRDAIEFTFGRPVRAFGAWFGDLETRVTGGGIPALLRLYDENGTLLSESVIAPTATTCAGDLDGCGNNTTRWLGFVADRAEPVSRMVVIVGDEDAAGTGLNEGLSVIGPTLAFFPTLGLAKRVTSVVDHLDGTQTIDYEFVVENTGDLDLTDVAVSDDLTAVFGADLVAVGAVTGPPGSVLTPSSTFDGSSDTVLAAGALAIGETATFSVSATVRPGAPGPFDNTASVVGTTPRGDVISDVSQDGAVPDADGDGDPRTDSAVTPVTFALTGSITVTASVTDGPAGGVTGDHEFEITCTPAAGPATVHPVTVTLSAQASASATVTGIPVGAECTIAQVLQPAPPAGYAWTTVTGSGAVVTLTTTGQNAAVSIDSALRLLQGDLAISLVIDGSPAGGLTTEATYAVDCGAAFSGTRTISLVGATSGSATITGIPAGATCAVTETVSPAAPEFFAWQTSDLVPATVDIVDGATALVAATRELRAVTGTVAIDYDVTGAPLGGLTGDVVFDLDCGAAGTHSTTITLAGATTGSVSVPGIPAPSSCTISLASVPAVPQFTALTAPVFSTNPIAVTDGGDVTVTVSSELRATAGDAVVGVTVAGAPATGLTGSATVRLDCGAAGTVLATVTFAGSSAATTTVTIPAPATCTVSPLTRPAAPDGYIWAGDLDPSNSPVTITDGGSTDVAVSGALQRIVGALAVTIDVTDAPASGVSGSFDLAVDCGVEGSYTLAVPFTGASSASAVVSGIPAPADCTITESTRPAAPAGYRWITPTLAPLSATVTSVPSALTATASLELELPTLPLPTTPTTTPAGTGSGLALTGALILPVTGVALALLVGGATLLVLRRRPRRG
jgi:hypothetical protein